MSRRRTAGLALAGALSLASLACGSMPPPKSLSAAADRLNSTESEQLLTTHPRLLAEAKAAHRQAKKAYQRGDLSESELHAQRSIQKFETAKSLDARDAALAKMAAMQAALGDVEKQAEQLGRERDALMLFQEANARFDEIESQAPAANDNSLKARSARAILTARKKQADAVGAGAPSGAPQTYGSGATLLVAAVDALDGGLFAEAEQNAEQAYKKFDDAISESKDSDLAKARQTATKEEVGKAVEKARRRARRAINEAETAKAAAIAERLAQIDPPRMERGDYLLEMANARYKEDEFDAAEQRAKEALDVLRPPKPKKTPTGAVATAAMTPGVATSTAPPMGTAAAPAPNFTPAPQTGGPSLVRQIEDALIQVRVERAEALGAQIDQLCPARYREFDAFVQLADDLYQRGRRAQAMEYAIRASERLRQCEFWRINMGPSSPAAGKTGVRRPGSAARPQTAKEKKAAEVAKAAIRKAQSALGQAISRGAAPMILSDGRSFISRAQGYFIKGKWKDATATANQAIKVLAVKTASKKTDKAVPAATAKAALTAKAQPAKVCKAHPKQLKAARRAQKIAATKTTDQARLAEHERGVHLLAAADRTAKQGACDDAALMIQSATDIFTRLSAPPKVNTVKIDTCAIDGLRDAYVAQGAARLGIRNPGERGRYDRAVKSVRRAEELAGKGRCKDSQNLVDSALKTFDEFASREPIKAAPVVQTIDGATGQATLPTSDADPAAEAAARREIGRAQVLESTTRKKKSDQTHALGRTLLGQAKSLLARKQYANAAATAQQAAFAFESLPPDEEGAGEEARSKQDDTWKPVYHEILEVLALRDQANSLVETKEDKQAMVKAAASLKKSRAAWEVKSFTAAGQYAQSAAREYQAVIEQIKERTAQAAKNAKLDDEARAKAEEEARLAEEARIKAAEEAAKAQAEKEAAEKRAAEEAIAAAEAKAKECNEKRCPDRDGNTWARADEQLKNARSSLKQGIFLLAKEQAERSSELLQGILDMKIEFMMPSEVTYVSKQGEKLVLSPRITFESGGAVISASVIPACDELAKVIKENAGMIERIEVHGYTDSRGNADKNRALSQRRAEAVRQHLIGQGVNANLISATGHGEDDPIASNKTKDGRERNRRVEIIMRLKGGDQ